MSEIFVVLGRLAGMVSKRVKERLTEGKCLCCDKPHVKRGLCVSCYNAFAYCRRKLVSKRAKAEFESKLISRGKLLDSHDTSYKAKSVFEKLASKS